MPRFAMACPACSQEWESWEGFIDAKRPDCPSCGTAGVRQLGSVLIRCTNVHTMDPLERQMALENKADIESARSAAIAEGRDPDEARQYHVPHNVGLPREFIPTV